MAALLVELLSGILVIGMTLRDVFETVVVPGESRSSLRLVRRLALLFLPIFRRRGRNGISTAFAPSLLVAAFLIWMLLLIVGFGLVVHSLRSWYEPPLPSFSQALFVAGSSIVTVGLSETDATGPSRWVNIAAGLCGLGVLTLAITYLLEIQSTLSRRDSGIVRMMISAGEPPSAIRILERYAELGCQAELTHVLIRGRDWCAELQQSHASHPSLIYFRSVGIGAGWPAALGTLLDLACLLELLIDLPDLRGEAILLREQGIRVWRRNLLKS